MLQRIIQQLSGNPFLHRAATALGLTRRPGKVRESAKQHGAELKFRMDHVRWQKGGDVVLLPYLHLDRINELVLQMPAITSKLIFKKQGALRVADCRVFAECQLPSGKIVRLPGMPEPVDFLDGYFRRRPPQPGEFALDAGAYVGEATLEMAQRVGPTGRVFAFEPDPTNRRWLEQNIASSGLTNITVVPKGIWHETTTLDFWTVGNAGSAFLSLSEASTGAGKVVQIEVLSPRDAFAIIGRVPDFIKMDIEGAEVEVVEAIIPLLGDAKPRFAIASYHDQKGAKTSEFITPMLTSAGFHVETGYPAHQTTWAWAR
jgi:FkbM family methyltransferase